ncbi:paired amphipathic helix protein Sin3-like 3 isoform X2 [Cynara cardunculus var. scolymus]|uniref:paired amphipathic helix protein Sin3-like 3 isoform X2 n=1 Tax=Cynara cardunculus var. scolymus TaxID=59895 RepID=UPI000D6308FD|nr:paired amphipathic helix protein Sin3-like 3 isoform X2 [Cynara cardunculus var. scolymus]
MNEKILRCSNRMKRSRDDDDVCKSPQVKRPFVSERPGHPQMMDSNGQKLTTKDALTYLEKVKDIFQDKKEKYDEFLEVMKDFKEQRTDTTGVIARVKELFEGHQELILGFSPFLPKGYEITLPREHDQHHIKKPLEFDEAILFVNKIKMRFQGQDHVYKYFLDTLSKYKKENKSIKEVHQEVANLLNDQQDLLKEFTNLLPDSSAAGSNHYCQASRNHNPGRDGRSPPAVAIGPLQSEKKTVASHAECKVSVDQSDPDHEKGCIMADKEQKRHGEKEKDTWENTEHREHHSDDRDCDRMHHLTQHKPAHTLEDSVAELFHKDVHGQMLCLREKVKERLSNADDYQAFLKCIAHYCTEIITRPQLQSLVNNLLGAYSDLVEEVDEFIDRSEKTRSLCSDGHLPGSPKVDGGDRNRDCDRDERDGDHEIKERNRPAIGSKDASPSKPSSLSSKEKYLWKSIQELDLSNCECCTPSYRLLPKNYPIPSVSQRTKIGVEVLNDHWVSVTSGSEDFSFKHMRKNQYEESLFRCEDDRFELDMLLESVNVTAKRVEELLDRINDNSIKTDSVVHIEDFTAIHLRCIGRLYGDHGLDVMDVLRKNASVALPVILARLKQKQEEWLRCRSDTKKVWAEIYAKNYHKSLDHRSFYFKQQDSKSLSAKALLAEIKETSEEKSIEDNIRQCIAPGKKQHSIPHQEFKYSALDIHEDLYQLMKYSVAQSGSPEQIDKAVRIWTTFVEPMLGIPPRPSCVADQDATKTSNHAATSGSTAVRQSNIKVPHGAFNIKQSTIAKNGDEEVFTENSCSFRASMLDDKNGLKENGFSNTGHFGHKSDSLCNTPKHETFQISVHPSDARSGLSKQVITNEPILIQNASIATGPEKTHGIFWPCITSAKSGTTALDGGLESDRNKILSSPEGGACKKPVSSSNAAVAEGGRTERCHNGTDSYLKIERNEGESSVNGDTKGDNLAAYRDPGVESTHKSKDITVNNFFYQNRHQQGDLQNRAGVDDKGKERAHRSLDNSENGDDTGSESADAEDLSPKEQDGDHDNATGSEGMVDGMGDESCQFSEHFLEIAKPFMLYVPATLHDKKRNSRVFYGNDDFYVFFRLHQILYTRLEEAKEKSLIERWRGSNDTTPNDSYARFLDLLYSFLDGAIDSAKYEDECRAVLGTWSFPVFTLDKLIDKLTKLLLTIAMDEVDNKLLDLYAYENLRKGESFIDELYNANASVIVNDSKIFRFECSSIPETCRHTRLTIQMMNFGYDKSEAPASLMDPDFAAYLSTQFLSVVPGKKRHRIFLKRNKSKSKSKYACEDEDLAMAKAMEGFHVANGLEFKIATFTYKVYYVMGTADSLVRMGRKRINNRVPSHEVASLSNGHSLKTLKFLKLLLSRIRSTER